MRLSFFFALSFLGYSSFCVLSSLLGLFKFWGSPYIWGNFNFWGGLNFWNIFIFEIKQFLSYRGLSHQRIGHDFARSLLNPILNQTLNQILNRILSKPQLNHNSTQPNITLSWVRHENDFAYHPTHPHKLNVTNISAVTDPILIKL